MPSKISWTGETWNPTVGCRRVSPGCEHCYAERQAGRIVRMGGPAANLYLPVVRFAGGTRKEGRWNGRAAFAPDRLAIPLGWRKPRRVFVDSMSDLFHDDVTDDQIAAVFGVMAATPNHTYQLLTKRPRRILDWLQHVARDAVRCNAGRGMTTAAYCFCLAQREANNAALAAGPVVAAGLAAGWPLPNVWLGVSVEDQQRADERIPLLLQAPAAVRFLSCEPLLGPLDLRPYLIAVQRCRECSTGGADDPHLPNRCIMCSGGAADLSWVIGGCESGAGARSCNVDWLRSLRDQSAAAGVAFFLKQAEGSPGWRVHAGPAPAACAGGGGSLYKNGGVIELPYLDGVQHAAFPEVARG